MAASMARRSMVRSEFTNLVQLQERVQYFKAALKCTFVLVTSFFIKSS